MADSETGCDHPSLIAWNYKFGEDAPKPDADLLGPTKQDEVVKFDWPESNVCGLCGLRFVLSRL